jgi:hypothetical protein
VLNEVPAPCAESNRATHSAICWASICAQSDMHFLQEIHLRVVPDLLGFGQKEVVNVAVNHFFGSDLIRLWPTLLLLSQTFLER